MNCRSIDFWPEKAGAIDVPNIGTDAFHPTIGAAVDAYLAEHAVDWEP